MNIICLTPVKNEAWILDRFLKCTSLWADHIIIADQCSEDNSRSIAQDYQKVILVNNPSKAYDEQARQKLLLNTARKIQGPRLLVALDADEILTSNFFKSTEWKNVLNAPKGTVIRFQWINIRPDFQTYWSPDGALPMGFIDDGSEHSGGLIHSPRIPLSNCSNTITLRNIMCLHYQYTNWERMKSKQRWYQVWERINNPHRSSIDIYRQYHHMEAIKKEHIRSLNKDWLLGYIKNGIDMTSVTDDEVFWYDREVLKFFDYHGTKKFRREAIWDVNWEQLANGLGKTVNALQYKDPRRRNERYIHMWLKKTQGSSNKLSVRIIQKILRQLGW
jgi:glycosyltransferase involved in cell wall biosynthesis